MFKGEVPIIPVLFNYRTKGSSSPRVNDHANERMESDSDIREEEYAFSDSLTSSSCVPFFTAGYGRVGKFRASNNGYQSIG